MITITQIASGSSGNSYMIDDGETRLLLECGLPWKRIQKDLEFQTSSLSGCLCSHEHQDHSKAVKDAVKSGVDVYLSKGTAEAIGVTGHRVHHIEAMKQIDIGSWKVLPFDAVHDAAEPLSFLLQNRVGEKLLFITDTAYVKPRFKGITHLMIEANFSNEILRRNIASGRVEPSRKIRLLESHFSLERVKEFLKVNDLSRLQSVHLLHLSSDNSDEDLFKKTIQQVAGVPVYVAKE